MFHSATVIEKAVTPNGEIQLQKRGKDYEIIFNGVFLMATYNGESEKLLVKAALDAAGFPEKILLAGLGAGFSLAEAVNDTRLTAITVVEIEAKIIEWNRTYLAPYSQHALADPRVTVINADFPAWLETATEKYDVICLDIDNGPDWLVLESNSRLYRDAGMHALLKRLNRSGALSFWSASRSDGLQAWLQKWFYRVTELAVPHQRGEPDYIYLAARPKPQG